MQSFLQSPLKSSCGLSPWSTSKQPATELSFAELLPITAPPVPRPPVPEFIQLDFEELSLFEQVQNQYQNLGVRFEGAIAIHPSNPAFASPSGSLVIIPSGEGLSITVHFDRPIRQTKAVVIGARSVRLTAFDRHGNVLIQERTSTQLQIPAEAIASLPAEKLAAIAEKIVRIVFASDAPFILDSLFCD
jgi:hypothetical protein